MNLRLLDQYRHNRNQHIQQADQHPLANIARTQRRVARERTKPEQPHADGTSRRLAIYAS